MSDSGSADRFDHQIEEHPATVTAALTQVLDGTTLVPNPECGTCRRHIHTGQCVTVYAYRRRSEARWQVARVYCPRCERTEIDEPTQGWAEAIVSGELLSRWDTTHFDPQAVIAWAGGETGHDG